tara:strand:- start:10265 stop:10942 length:678 start_codon:yes stop_codon:yes gene_type:complete
MASINFTDNSHNISQILRDDGYYHIYRNTKIIENIKTDPFSGNIEYIDISTATTGTFKCNVLDCFTLNLENESNRAMNIILNPLVVSTITEEPELGTIANIIYGSNVDGEKCIWKYGWYKLDNNEWSPANNFNDIPSDKNSSELKKHLQGDFLFHSTVEEDITTSNDSPYEYGNNHIVNNVDIHFTNYDISCNKLRCNLMFNNNFSYMKINDNNINTVFDVLYPQ